jgi:hypothetical protein
MAMWETPDAFMGMVRTPWVGNFEEVNREDVV